MSFYLEYLSITIPRKSEKIRIAKRFPTAEKSIRAHCKRISIKKIVGKCNDVRCR
jgi:hypothetical protein